MENNELMTETENAETLTEVQTAEEAESIEVTAVEKAEEAAEESAAENAEGGNAEAVVQEQSSVAKTGLYAAVTMTLCVLSMIAYLFKDGKALLPYFTILSAGFFGAFLERGINGTAKKTKSMILALIFMIITFAGVIMNFIYCSK